MNLPTVLAFILLWEAAPAKESAWNGTWVLDVGRSTPGIKDQAADAYRFTLQSDGSIKWEIPSLGEVVTGKIDGQPMPIHRTKPTPGLTLSVMAEGPTVLLYRVARSGKPEGEGRMTLVENGKAWVDLSWPAGQPQYAGEFSWFAEVHRGNSAAALEAPQTRGSVEGTPELRRD